MANRDFFSSLREKLFRKPDRAFDKAFWKRFDREFGERPARFPLWYLLPIGASVLLVLTLWKQAGNMRGDSVFIDEAPGVSAILDEAPVLENLDLFVVSSEGEDLTALGDEEWEALLAEEE